MRKTRATGASRRGYQALVLCAALAAAVAAGAAAVAAGADGLPTATTSELKAAFKATGKPRLVHLWATWCAPCIAEWPRLAPALREMAGARLDVVTVALDEPRKSEDASRVLRESGGVPGLSVLAPPARVFTVLRAVDPDWNGEVPATFLLDARGKLVHVQRGSTRLPLLLEAIAGLPSDKKA